MSGPEPPGVRFEYEKLAAYSLLLAEALFEILKEKGFLTHDEVHEHMKELSHNLQFHTAGVEFMNKTPN